MKKILRIILSAGLLACVGVASAQEGDTTTYSSNSYSQDTTTYEDSDREQQGSDTYNHTQNETQYSDRDDSPESTDRKESGEANVNGRSDEQQGSWDRKSSTSSQGTNPAQDTTGNPETYGDQGDRSENRSSEYYDRKEREKTESAGDSLETGNEKDDRSEFPETSSSDRGWNQEAGTPPIHNQDTSMLNENDSVGQQDFDRNRNNHRTGDQSYQDERPKNTEIGSQDDIGPGKEEAHRQARKELSTATDTLDYASQRRADPDKVGNRIEHMADTVSEKMHEKDRAKHGMED